MIKCLPIFRIAFGKDTLGVVYGSLSFIDRKLRLLLPVLEPVPGREYDLLGVALRRVN